MVKLSFIAFNWVIGFPIIIPPLIIFIFSTYFNDSFNLINYIDLNYNYSLVVDKKIDLDYSYNVISRIKIYNDDEGDLIYKKDEAVVFAPNV